MRLRFACAAALALAATAGASAPAQASAFLPAFDPLQSNRPHLAWRGEEVRLVHCAAGLNPDSGAPGDGSAQYDADWAVMAWSGSGVPASVAGGSVRFVIDDKPGSPHFGQQCVRANFRSAGAGLAVVQLDIRNQSTGASLVSRQFLAGWLSLKEVRLDDGFGGTTVYDGPGWGNYNWLRARVTATLPLSGFAELLQPAGPFPPVIHLPAEAAGSPAAGQGDPTTWYDDLARRLATTTSSETAYRNQPWLMWDVHDDQSTAAGHVDGDAAVSPASPYDGTCESFGVDFLPILDTAIDAVDNCSGGPAEEGPFSRIWPTFTDGLAIGPFDPLRAGETFLGDGQITAGDVVLPSAPIELVIAPNSGAPGDVSGTGTLEALDKEDVYVRKAEAGHDAAHNMYAPFYRSYIPATRAELAGHGLSSGTDAQWSPRYPKYLTCDPSGGTAQASEDCSYAYWEVEDVLESVVGQDTGCLYRYRSGAPEYRLTPMGDQAVVVYTDEHGEAMVKYVPGWDFYFDSLAANFPGVLNADGGCDLQEVSPLGTAEITATARYPGQSVLDTDKVSNVVTESTYNNLSKDIACAPKAPSGPDRTRYICTALTIDIDGTAMAQSRVCFTATGASSMAAYPAGTPFTLEGVGRLCVLTDWNGEAKVELAAECSTPTGSVTADFADERVVRTAAVDFSYCPAPSPPPVTTTTPTTTTTPPATTITAPTATTTTTQVTAPTPAPTTTTTAPPPAATTTTKTTPKPGLALVRIKTVTLKEKRARVVEVRVNGAVGSATLEVRLVKSNGKTLRRVTRIVAANRIVRVPNLALDRVVKTVAVKILASSAAAVVPVPSVPKTQPAKTTVGLLRVKTVTVRGKRSRVVEVRVNGTARTAKVEVRLVKSNGRTLRRVTRVVPTNRVVRVPKLKLDRIVKTVRVRLV